MIKLCPDGKYRWYYEFPMLKNPVILFTVWKVMAIAALAPALIVLLSELSNGLSRAIIRFLAVYGIGFGVLMILSCIGYFVLAACYGFHYVVLFEMDDEGVSHMQQGRQFKKAQALGWLSVAAGMASNSPAAVAAGIQTGSRQRMMSEFKNVEKVIGLKGRNTIKLNQTFAKNQIYVNPEDYEFVWKYITSRCKNAEIK